MRTETIKIYQFEELSDTAQEKAIQEFQYINVDHEWWDSVFEDASQIGLKITEFDTGQTAACKGKWIEDAKDVADKIIENHGDVCETHRDAKQFLTDLAAAKTAFEAQPDYDAEYDDFDGSGEYEELCEEFKKTILEDYLLILRKEYQYLLGEEAIKDTILANEYEFTEDGKHYVG
jgi:hypothetical protein